MDLWGGGGEEGARDTYGVVGEWHGQVIGGGYIRGGCEDQGVWSCMGILADHARGSGYEEARRGRWTCRVVDLSVARVILTSLEVILHVFKC